MSAVTLRAFSEPTVEQYRALITDPKVTRHMPLARSEYSDEWIVNWINNKAHTWENPELGPWSVWLGDQFLGWAGVEPEPEGLSLGMVLHRRYWGLGREVFATMLPRIQAYFGESRLVIELPGSRSSEVFAARLGLLDAGEQILEGRAFKRYFLDLERFNRFI